MKTRILVLLLLGSCAPYHYDAPNTLEGKACARDCMRLYVECRGGGLVGCRTARRECAETCR